MNKSNILIKHDQQHQTFSIKLRGAGAHVKYDSPDIDIMNIKEIYVPTEFRNYGLGSLLAEHTLNYAKTHQKQIIPSCPFIVEYLDHYPEYKSLILSSK